MAARRPLLLLALAASAVPIFAGKALAAPPPGAHGHRHVCGAAARAHARCHADVVTDANGAPLATTGPAGYGPADIRSAYGLPSTTAGAGQTVAIVDAYDDPNAEADLGVYRAQFGLPPCTAANGCFRKRDEHGGTSYPVPDSGWSEEISLDLDMVSAACPQCHILLVEGSSSSLNDLDTAENEAVALGATEVSNSFGAGEWSGESAYAAPYNHPGVPIVASSGDTGYGDVEFPAVLPTVTAAGGTQLARAANGRGWIESAWSGASSGCSAYVAKPSWQHDPGCSLRSVADVSADADPNTGLSVYDSFLTGGWLVVGGTSAASPLIAATYALAGNGSSVANASLAYATPTALSDVGQTYFSRTRSETGLTGYWRLGEASGQTSAADATGAHPGTYQGSVTLGQPGALAGDSNTAASFAGAGYVSLASLGSGTSFTLEGWTNLTSAAAGNPSGDNALFGGWQTLRLITRPNGVYAGVTIGGTEYAIQVSTPPNVGVWVHWSLTRSGTTLALYRNGAALGQRSNLPSGTNAISGTIGAYASSAYRLQGSIDEVAIYSSALPQATLQDHYYLGASGAVSGSNGSCGGGYLCTALPGYDGPTGVGTPLGVGAF